MTEGRSGSGSWPLFRMASALVAMVLLEALILWLLSNCLPGTLGFVDASAKFWQTESLARGQASLIYPSAHLDPDFRYIPDAYVALVDGKPYTTYLNVFCLLAAGVWPLLGRWGCNLIGLLAGALTMLALLWLACREKMLARKDAWLLVLVLWVTTPLLVYSILPLEHLLAGAFAAGAFLAVRPERSEYRLWRLGAAGALLALAALTRGECYLLALAMGLAVMWLRRRSGMRAMLAAGGAMFAGGVVVLGIWFAIFPMTMALGKVAMARSSGEMPMGTLTRLWHLLFYAHPGPAVTSIIGEYWANWISVTVGVSLLSGVVLGVAAGAKRSWLRHVAMAALLVGLGLGLVCWRVEGLLVVCPVLLGAVFLVRSRETFANTTSVLVAATSLLFGLLVWMLIPSAGASQFGPRFLIPVVVPLAAVAFCTIRNHLEHHPDRYMTAMLVLALLAGCLTEAKGVLRYRRGGDIAFTTENTLAEVPSPLVVFPPFQDGFYIYRAPKALVNTPVLQARNDEEFIEIVGLLRRNEVREFSLICTQASAEARQDLLRLLGVEVLRTRELPFDGLAIVATLRHQ